MHGEINPNIHDDKYDATVLGWRGILQAAADRPARAPTRRNYVSCGNPILASPRSRRRLWGHSRHFEREVGMTASPQ